MWKFPTQGPLNIEVSTDRLETVTRQLQKPTKFATQFEDKVQEGVRVAKEKAVAEGEAEDETKQADKKHQTKQTL